MLDARDGLAQARLPAKYHGDTAGQLARRARGKRGSGSGVASATQVTVRRSRAWRRAC